MTSRNTDSSQSRTRETITTAALAAFLLTTSPAWAAPIFQGLGNLGGDRDYSHATGMSADGSTVVGASASPFGYQEPFRWTSTGGMQGLGFLLSADVFDGAAMSVNGDGSVVVGYCNDLYTGAEAFRWTSAGGMQGLGGLSADSVNSAAYGVSGDGSIVVGGGFTTTTSEAFRWTSAGGMQGQGYLPGGNASVATGVSSDGTVVVGQSISGSGPEAFRWSGGVMVGVGDLSGGSFNSIAYGVSSDGSTIVGQGDSDSGLEALRWTSAGGIQGLGDLPGGSFASMATAVSSDGSIVLGAGNITYDSSEAFIWDTTHGMRSLQNVFVNDYGLDLTGWSLVTVAGISADGRTFSGTGRNPLGNHEAWTATVPEPSSLALLITGGIFLLRRWSVQTERARGRQRLVQHETVVNENRR